MASAATLLTIDEYHQRYAHENGWEYWFGEAIRKPVPTWLHAILQVLVADLLREGGISAARNWISG